MVRVLLDRANGKWGPDPNLASFPTPTAALAPAPPPPAEATSALVEPFFAKRKDRDNTTGQVIAQERATMRRFLEICGDHPPAAYGRGDVTRFLDMMRQLPAKYATVAANKDRLVADLIADADAEDAPRLTDKTIKRHLSTLSQFLQFAVDRGALSVSHREELVRGHSFRTKRKARDQRDAWTPEELTTLFRSPVWTGCASKTERSKAGSLIIRDAKFWLPILAAYHGGRLEEFADLRRRDVRVIDGVWIMAVEWSEGGPDERERRIKNENANRNIPLHPELVRLGFLDYVQKTAPKAEDALFPDLAPQGPDQKRGPRMTRWFGHYRKAIGVYREGVGMHAFRHTAITRLTNAITDFQQKRHRDFIMGHGGGGTEGDTRYDKGAGLQAAAATLALLAYPEIDLSHLHTPAT